MPSATRDAELVITGRSVPIARDVHICNGPVRTVERCGDGDRVVWAVRLSDGSVHADPREPVRVRAHDGWLDWDYAP